MIKSSPVIDPRLTVSDRALSGIPNATPVERSPLVEESPMGYNEGMVTETRPAPQWRMPIAEYATHLRARRRSSGTVYLRSYHLRVISQSFRTRSPYSLIADDLEAFLSNMGRHVDRNTQRSYLASMRSFYRWAITHGRVQIDPTEFIDPIPLKEGVPRPAEWETINEAIGRAEPRVQLMIHLAAACGMRAIEIARLHTSDLRQTHQGPMISIRSGKGDKPRDVPATPRIAYEIEQLTPGWVFPSRKRGTTGAHIHAKRVSELVSEALPEGVTAHMLRHAFATAFYADTKDLFALQKMLGHSSSKTTEVYTQVPVNSMRSGQLSVASRLR